VSPAPMKITKDLYDRSLNPDMKIFAKLSSDVQDALSNAKKIQWLHFNMEWYDDDDKGFAPIKELFENHVYRIHPDTPHEI